MIQVVVTDDHGAGVTPVQVFQQLSHRNLLLSRSRVSGLTADVQTTLVAYAYRVFVVVLAFYMQWAPTIHSGLPGSISPLRRMT